MQILLRGQTTPVDVPDQPASPSTSTTVTRGAADHIDSQTTQTTSDHVDTQTTVDHGSAGAVISLLNGPILPTFGTGTSAVTITPDTTQAAATVTSSSASDIQWFAHSDALPQFTSVPSVVTDLQGPAVGTHSGDLGSLSGFSDSYVARGESIAPLALNASDFTDHGWFIVPSASAEYGDAHVDMAAATDGFAFDMATGDFTSDWFLV